MTDETWEVIDEVSGQFQAEIVRGLLEAQEIPVVLSQEGLGHVYALTIGTLGTVQVLVPAREAERARQLLEEYRSGASQDLTPPDEPELGEEANP
jgi:hypothetical protein